MPDNELKSQLLAKEAERKRTTSPEDSPRQKQRGEVHAEELDDLCMDLIAERGLSINLMRSSTFARLLERASLYEGGVYRPPSSERLRTVLLQRAVQRMDDKLEPMRLERQRFGCGVACDGFTSTSIRPLLCFTICSPSGAELESVIDTSGHAKTAQFYYEQLKAAILRVGVDDVVAVFSDNARACVKAGQKLEEDDELRVFFMPCGSHSLNLALEDIGKLPWAAETILLAKSLIHFIRARHFPLDLFRTVSQELECRP